MANLSSISDRKQQKLFILQRKVSIIMIIYISILKIKLFLIKIYLYYFKFSWFYVNMVTLCFCNIV